MCNESTKVPPVDNIKPYVVGSQPVLSTLFQLIQQEQLGGESQDASEMPKGDEQVEAATLQVDIVPQLVEIAGQLKTAEVHGKIERSAAPLTEVRVYGSPLPCVTQSVIKTFQEG